MSDISERRDREIERRKNRKTHRPMPSPFSTSLVGTKYIDQQLLRDLAVAHEPALELTRQPDNEHDPNAISVTWDCCHMGHITRPVAMRLAPEMDAGETWTVRVDGINFYDDQPVGVAITCTREDT